MRSQKPIMSLIKKRYSRCDDLSDMLSIALCIRLNLFSKRLLRDQVNAAAADVFQVKQNPAILCRRRRTLKADQHINVTAFMR